MTPAQAAAKAIAALAPEVRKATVYLDPKLVVSVCRRHKFSKRTLSADFVLKIGRPNFEERAVLARQLKAGKGLPRGVQLKAWPKPRAKKGA